MQKSHKASDLINRIQQNYDNPLTGNSLDIKSELEILLRDIGEDSQSTGGKISFSGLDPIAPSRIMFGTMSALALALKSAMVAAIWRDRTGQGQDIHVNVGKALRRFTPFHDQKWELINGMPGDNDPFNPFNDFPVMHPTADGGWAMPGCWYPGLRQRGLEFLNATDSPQAIAAAIRRWDRYELEEAAEKEGIALAILRSVPEALAHDAVTTSLAPMPLIEITKIADSEPRPFSENPATPLEGIRALGLSHVIAGPSIGRALALHGADVLNVFKPMEVELSVFHYTSHVGMRSCRLDYRKPEGRDVLDGLLKDADVFFGNRRHGYFAHNDFDAGELSARFPGIVLTRVIYMGDKGPWSKRAGFDITAGAALGLNNLEGTDEKPEHPSIFVIADYAAGWLAEAGTLAALRRRAVEGGSYKVTVSLGRTVLWLLSLGIFDKAYAHETAGSDEAHTYPDPEQFTADTPVGRYTGVTEMVDMSATPGEYRFPLLPIGSSQPVWLD